MKKSILITLILIAVGIVSCGKQAEDMKQTMDAFNNVKKLGEASQEINNYQQVAEKRMAERRAKGDTNAIHFKTLQSYLPQSISGYTMETPEGQTTRMGEFSLSQASVKFVKKSPTGEDFIRIEIADYNENWGIYQGLTAWAIAGVSVENSDGWEKSYQPGIEYVYGYEKYHNKDKKADLIISVGFRFLISMEANNQSGTEQLKSILNSMKLKEMANL